MAMGNIRQARETVSQALRLADEAKYLENLRTEFAHKAYYEFLLGSTSQAYQDFEIALHYEQKRMASVRSLDSMRGNQQAEFFIRLQTWKPFESVNAYNLKISNEYQWNNTLAICHMLQGWYKICRGQLSQAENELVQAERIILRPSSMVQEICRLDWV
jgi:hypothetical protein